MALDSQGLPHTISIDPSQFGSDSGVEYASFDGESWSVEEVGSGPTPYEFGTGIALDSQDRPHVVWFDSGDKSLKYAVKEGGSWTISTVDSEGDVGRYPSLALDGQDNPVVSYLETTSSKAGYIKLARWDGGKWSLQRLDQLENVFPGFLGATKTSSLVLDGGGNPVVAYSDEKVVKLAWWDGAGWNLETVATAGDSPFGQQVSLARDIRGGLHLTFADVSSKSSPGVKGAVKYARGTLKAVLSANPPGNSRSGTHPDACSRRCTKLFIGSPAFRHAGRRAGPGFPGKAEQLPSLNFRVADRLQPAHRGLRRDLLGWARPGRHSAHRQSQIHHPGPGQ